MFQSCTSNGLRDFVRGNKEVEALYVNTIFMDLLTMRVEIQRGVSIPLDQMFSASDSVGKLALLASDHEGFSVLGTAHSTYSNR